MLPRRFTLRDGRTLEIRRPRMEPYHLTLDDLPIATIERAAMSQWNSIRLYDGSWLQVRSERRWGIHFDVVHDGKRVPGSLDTLEWRLGVLSALVAWEGCGYVCSGAVVRPDPT